MKKYLFNNDALSALERGAKKLSDTVSVTLGPKGRNVALDRNYVSPLITNDGVTIAKEIELSDPFENMGAKIIKEAAANTNTEAGDGTTTACLLSYAIISNAKKYIDAGENPVQLRNELQSIKPEVISEIKKLSRPVETNEQIKQVATLSAGSEEIGEIISSAIKQVGTNGIISLEDSSTGKSYTIFSKGYTYNKGFTSLYFCSDKIKQSSKLNNPLILVVDKKITAFSELIPALEIAQGSHKELLIIASEVESEPLTTLVINRVNGNLPVTVVSAPGFAQKRKDMLSDICTLTGSTLFASENGKFLESITEDDFGSAKSVEITKDSTTIIEGCVKKEIIDNLTHSLLTMQESQTDPYEKNALEERIGKLQAKAAIIYVGAKSEVEAKELKLRIEDALAASRAAIKEGITPGGGRTLMNVAKCLQNTHQNALLTGHKILIDSFYEPIRVIAQNAGMNADDILAQFEQIDNPNITFSAINGTFENCFDSGIVDPTKVTRCAFENALSVASTLITTSVLVADEPTKQ